MAAENEPILDEKFAAEDTEEDHAGDDVGGEIVQTIGGSDLPGAAGEEYEEEGIVATYRTRKP